MDLKILRTARRVAKLSQTDLAAKAGVDNSMISMLENGKRDIGTVNYEAVARIAHALNLTTEELFPIVIEDDAQRTA